MRIVHVIPGLLQGGAEVQLERLICATPEWDHIVVVLRDEITPTTERLRVKENCRLVLLRRVGLYKMTRQLRGTLQRLVDPDTIVQGWMYHGNVAASICSVGLPGRCFWNIRRSSMPSGNTFFVALMGALLSRIFSVEIFCNSHSGIQRHAMFGYPARRMIYAPNGFTAPHLPRGTSKDGNSLNIVCVGRFHRDKGQDLLFRELSLLGEAGPDVLAKNVNVFFVGRGVEEGLSKLFAKISTDRISVRYLGERSDVADILGQMDILCLPSRTEGFPNILCEAMLAKLFCIASDVGDVPHILPKGNLIVQAECPRSISDAILASCNVSKETLRRIGHKNRQHVIERYSIEKTVDIYRAKYTS